jgi:hypothetical protein
MMRKALCAVGALAIVVTTVSSAFAAPLPIRDCPSFRAWFRQQPGYQLTLDGQGPYEYGAPAPRKGSDSLHFPTCEGERIGGCSSMSYYRGNIGGGGCVGALYDPSHRIAAFEDLYDTAADLGETIVVTPPAGIKTGRVAALTRNGVALGMTLRQVEAIEGKGWRRMRGGDLIVTYGWSVSGELFAIRFLLRGGRVIAMDYFGGF